MDSNAVDQRPRRVIAPELPELARLKEGVRPDAVADDGLLERAPWARARLEPGEVFDLLLDATDPVRIPTAAGRPFDWSLAVAPPRLPKLGSRQSVIVGVSAVTEEGFALSGEAAAWIATARW